jgi:hypothetical protein
MVKVIAFPPVGVVGSMWTVAAPVQRSRSLITGRRYVSRFGRARVQASLRVSALSKTASGAGYSEMLIRHIDGGADLVRLNSYPINWHLDQSRLAGLRSSDRLLWSDETTPLLWQSGGQPLYWFNGTVLAGTVSGDVIEVTGLPPGTLVCRPGEFVQVFSGLDSLDGPVAQVTAEAYSDADGVAMIRLFDPIPDGVYPRVNIGVSDSRVFEVTGIPSVAQPLGQNWFYDFSFSEVFADEVQGGFDEVNPWV